MIHPHRWAASAFEVPASGMCQSLAAMPGIQSQWDAGATLSLDDRSAHSGWKKKNTHDKKNDSRSRNRWYHVDFESCLCEQSEQQLSTGVHYTHQLQS